MVGKKTKSLKKDRLVYVGNGVFPETLVRMYRGNLIYAPIGSPYYRKEIMGKKIPKSVYLKV